MADARITQLTALGARPDAGDLFVIVDISDTTQAATGTTKSVTAAYAMGTWTKETPSGALDGSNVTYTLAHTPIANTFDLVVQDQVFTETTDYSISGTTLTLVTALPAGFAGPFKAKYLYSV